MELFGLRAQSQMHHTKVIMEVAVWSTTVINSNRLNLFAFIVEYLITSYEDAWSVRIPEILKTNKMLSKSVGITYGFIGV